MTLRLALALDEVSEEEVDEGMAMVVHQLARCWEKASACWIDIDNTNNNSSSNSSNNNNQ